MKYLIFLTIAVIVNAQNLPFTDNFDSGNLDQWQIVEDEPQYSGPSNWFVQDEILKQTSNIWAYPAPDEFVYHLGTHVFTGSENWTDYSFNALVKATDNDGIGIIFRYQDEKNYYRIMLLNDANNGGPFQRLQKFVNGQVYTLYENIIPNSIPSGWFSLTADVRGNSISMYVNGEKLTTKVDNQYSAGKIGLTCYAMSGANFDSVSVTEEFLVYEKPEQTPVTVNRLPYIQIPTLNSVEIAWRTKTKAISKVEYGTTTSYGGEIIADTSGYIHHFEITGLLPNTKYYYRVYNGNNLYHESYFNTAKSEDTDSLRILVWGDSGVGNDIQYQVAALMETEVVDLALHVGDVSQGSGDEYDNIYFTPYKNIVDKTCVYVCIGNHDTYYDNAQTYLNDFYLPHNNLLQTERYYSFKQGNAFFINLDSNIDYSPDSPQYQFLVEQLQSEERSESFWTFVYFHHPPYCELWTGWGGDDGVREHLVPLFEQYDVDMVLNGHTHGYERGKLNGVYYIITGGGGGGLDDPARNYDHITVSLSKHHYTIITLNGEQLSLRAIDINGNIIDNLSFIKSATGIEEKTELLNKFYLHGNFPNPFNPSTVIQYEIPEDSTIKFKIYDLLGKEVYQDDLGFLSKGIQRYEFNKGNLASGVYIYSLIIESSQNNGITELSNKMVILK